MSVAGIEIDLTDLDRFASGFPHEVFVALRREAPVWWHAPTEHTPDGEGFWVISRHADVTRVFRDPHTFSSETGGDRPFGGTTIEDLSVAGVVFNMMDDPRHQRIRRLVSTGFTPRMIGSLEDDLRRRTRAIIDGALERGTCDFVVDIARELPLQAIATLMGVPEEDQDKLCDWVDAMSDLTGTDPDAALNLYQYGSAFVAERRRNPVDDMLSVVASASLADEDPAQLTQPELEMFFTLLFTAGSETTRKAVAGGILELVRTPDQWTRLRDDLALVPGAVEESVRWASPSVYKRRTATRAVELHGMRIPAGDKVTVWEMSANRDETVFDDPFRFDIDRSPNPHVGFGQGVHFCLGANLARLEIRVMLEELLTRVGSIELAGEPAYTRANRLWGLRSLPVTLTPA
ncbi:MAG: cytochrome P450 [Acidimicrobiia bacterium]